MVGVLRFDRGVLMRRECQIVKDSVRCCKPSVGFVPNISAEDGKFWLCVDHWDEYGYDFDHIRIATESLCRTQKCHRYSIKTLSSILKRDASSSRPMMVFTGKKPKNPPMIPKLRS